MNNAGTFKRTRIAPTPSGYLHLGNIYSFALTAALAQKHNIPILLRIDDMDRERVQKAYVQDIFDTLKFLDIPWHEGPRNYEEYEQQYAQLHRMNMYKNALNQLKETSAVFACACSRTQVQQAGTEGVYPRTCLHSKIPFDAVNVCWRLDTTQEVLLKVKNADGNLTLATLPEQSQYFIVQKKDGCPAYQLTSVIDDLHFGVDLVVRGTDLWDSTLAQQYLAVKLQQPASQNISFLHHPLMTDPENRKLSKSEGATSVQYLRRQGITAAEIYGLTGKMAGLHTPVTHWRDFISTI